MFSWLDGVEETFSNVFNTTKEYANYAEDIYEAGTELYKEFGGYLTGEAGGGGSASGFNINNMAKNGISAKDIQKFQKILNNAKSGKLTKEQKSIAISFLKANKSLMTKE